VVGPRENTYPRAVKINTKKICKTISFMFIITLNGVALALQVLKITNLKGIEHE